MANNYDAKSIKQLDTREAMRSRIQIYLGTSDDDGVYQSFKEIVNNSTDEILAGYGDSIEITMDIDNNIATIRDYGRGVPTGFRDDGTNVLVSIFTEAHIGGKFDKNSYKNSSGLNG